MREIITSLILLSCLIYTGVNDLHRLNMRDKEITALKQQLATKQYTEQQAFDRAYLIGYHCGVSCPTYVEKVDFEARQQVIMINAYELFKDTTNPDLSCALDAGKITQDIWYKTK